MFCREDGSPLHPDDVSKRFGAAVAGIDVPRITLHGLRHTWASLALQAGVSPKVVSERLGHASVSFTLDIYSHVMPGMQEDAARRLGSQNGCNRRRSRLRWPARAHRKAPIYGGFRSGPYRDRTCDLEIKSLLLYQLS